MDATAYWRAKHMVDSVVSGDDELQPVTARELKELLMPVFKCHKHVRAARIVDFSQVVGTDGYELRFAEAGPVYVTAEWMERHKPGLGGYFVQYEDGYQSFSPAEAFESGYTSLDAQAQEVKGMIGGVVRQAADTLDFAEMSNEGRTLFTHFSKQLAAIRHEAGMYIEANACKPVEPLRESRPRVEALLKISLCDYDNFFVPVALVPLLAQEVNEALAQMGMALPNPIEEFAKQIQNPTFRIENNVDPDGNPSGGIVVGRHIYVAWQSGPLGRGANRVEPNGAFVEDVIRAALQRIEFYQDASDGRFSCDENFVAINHLHDALRSLESRTARREGAGVEGTHAEDA